MAIELKSTGFAAICSHVFYWRTSIAFCFLWTFAFIVAGQLIRRKALLARHIVALGTIVDQTLGARFSPNLLQNFRKPKCVSRRACPTISSV